MKLDSHVGEIRVYVKKAVIHADGDVLHAQYIFGTPPVIEVEWNENVTVMERNVFHELIHNCHEGISYIEWERVYGEVDEDQMEAQQEENAMFLENKLFDLLKRNGLLRFPKPPKLA